MNHSFTVHQKNIQSLAIELFKAKRNISKHMMNNIFQMKGNRRYTLFYMQQVPAIRVAYIFKISRA